MSGSLSPVEVLLAKCQQVSEAIASHREAISDLTAERDGMVAELRRLGLSERAVGRLLGISGPRVNQIMNPAGITVTTEIRMPEGTAVVVSGAESAAVPVPPPAKPRRRSAKPGSVAPRTETLAAEGVPPVVLQEPAGAKPRRCTHPGTRVIGGFCKECDALVGPGGVLP